METVFGFQFDYLGFLLKYLYVIFKNKQGGNR